MLTTGSAEQQTSMIKAVLGNHRILLLGGDESFRLLMTDYTRDFNLTVILADDPQTGLEKMNKTPFDAILTRFGEDIDRMLTFRKEVRELNKSVPILFIVPQSCWTDIDFLNRILEDPRCDSLPEHADGKHLTEKLMQLLQAAQTEQTLQQLETKVRLNEEMSDSGRGLPIITKIASQISRERYSGLNETVFHIPRRGNRPERKPQSGGNAA